MSRTDKKKKSVIFFVFLLLCCGSIVSLRVVCAFDKHDVQLLNITLPAVMAGFRAYHNDSPIGKAVLQGLFGGCFMYHGIKMAPKLQEKDSAYAWKTKLIINMGASLAETAGTDFAFRMDIGPVWLIANDDRAKFKLGVNSTIAPIIQWAEGSKLDIKRSLKYGTLAFERETNADGTISCSGSLAYSNANTFITNPDGAHAGHELVHTYQYRRNAIYPFRLGNFAEEYDNKLNSLWLDDTAWTVNWGVQCALCKLKNENRSFDILLEKEAYYLEHHYRK